MQTPKNEAHAKARELNQARQAQKLVGADERKEARAARTDENQIARLDLMLGKGKGAVRERARLDARIKKDTNDAILKGKKKGGKSA